MGRLLLSESMSHENQRFAYKFRQQNRPRKVHSNWFFDNIANVKLTEHGRIHKKFRVTDIENLLETVSLGEYIDNASSQSN